MAFEYTPPPWDWAGEDYRGGWGWQILVGPGGEGLIVGADGDAPCKRLKAGTPVDPDLCLTGFKADDREHVNAVHVYLPGNAAIIKHAAELYEAAKAGDAARLAEAVRTIEGRDSGPAA